MSDDVIIRAENIGKCYTLDHQSGGGGYRRFSDMLIHAAKAPLLWMKTAHHEQRSANTKEDFWALKDVSFEIKRGEVVGIIGRNGAGKSTLLKILSRITEPTKGRITLDGRVASLLEVGTGFHPELTGRENIFLNGAILGMRKEEIKSKFDEIVAFAEIEKFLDTPVKRYSSGMYVRLAFAVAAHLEPEILIVDEVLAVGDAQFQAKCLGKMQDVARGGGRTVLFVSHNMGAVQSLCSRVILLQKGSVEYDGNVIGGTASYLSFDGNSEVVERPMRSGSDPTIRRVKLEVHAKDEEAYLDILTEIESPRAISVSLEIRFHDQMGVPCGLAEMGQLNSHAMLSLPEGRIRHLSRIPLNHLARGRYHLIVQIALPLVSILDKVDSGLGFDLDRQPREGCLRVMEQSWGYGTHELRMITIEAPI
jgi:lipopolysaccharide transport system ATP-binding protein